MLVITTRRATNLLPWLLLFPFITEINYKDDLSNFLMENIYKPRFRLINERKIKFYTLCLSGSLSYFQIFQFETGRFQLPHIIIVVTLL